MSEYRIERDSMGEVRVPANALYAAQTQRAVDNFPISGLTFGRSFLRALGLVKAAAAQVNLDLGLMDATMSEAIQQAGNEVAEGKWDAEFPIDIFQTGSGTSTNMNANEMIANRATQILGSKVHPNDHVNMGQSSNDVIPTAIHVAAYLETVENLLPALRHLHQTLTDKAAQYDNVVKTGRTLKHESQHAIPDIRSLIAVHCGDFLAVQQIAALGGTIQASQRIHQRRLARPRGTDQRDVFPALDRQRRADQRVDFDFAQIVDFADVVQLDQRLVFGIVLRHDRSRSYAPRSSASWTLCVLCMNVAIETRVREP